MDKDLSLKENKVKLIILICGDSKTGKKTIVKQIINERKFTTKDQSNFISYFFNFEEFVGKSNILIPVEIRVLNSEEQETELKLNKPFFNEALGAFVVTSITDNNSFINGEKWKDKIDLMCCLPNRFPLPIFLLINKYDEINNDKGKEKFKNLEYAEKDKIENYALTNQFFNSFLIVKNDGENINNKKIDMNISDNIQNKINEEDGGNKEENIKEIMISAEGAFQELIKVIMGFRDIRNAFITQAGGVIDNSDINIQNNEKNKKCIIY